MVLPFLLCFKINRYLPDWVLASGAVVTGALP